MGHYPALRIKAIDADTLHRTPNDVTVAIADGSDRRAEVDVLDLKAPVLELHGTLWHKHQSLALQAEPQVTMTVGEDAPHLGRIQVGTEDIDVITFQPTALGRQQEQAMAS